MHQLIADTLDDLLVKVFPKILRNGQRVKASKGWNRELSGVVLELRNPLARLSRSETKGTVFSCLGETLWYLAGSNELEFIKYYISIYGKFAESDGTIHGAYGPRLFDMRSGVNQVDNVIKLLRRKPSSRQAVVQLYNAEDLLKDYPPEFLHILYWQFIKPSLRGRHVARALKSCHFVPIIFLSREPKFLRATNSL